MRFAGFAPNTLADQIQNACAWALPGPTEGAAFSWRKLLRGAREVAHGYDDAGTYLRLQLAAHFASVGTFVPTDVDSHIRFHAWQLCETPERLAHYVSLIDETDAWDTSLVSAREITVPGVGKMSGHQGEWLAVRAGALGRALVMEGTEAIVESLVARIDAVVDQSLAGWNATESKAGSELLALQVATTVAHNLGDLSRVVESWKVRSESARSLQRRLARLGNETHGDPRFAVLSRVNTAIMAAENGRFLPLREAKALRLSRSLLLGLGPTLDAWGKVLATDAALDEEGPAGMVGGRGAILAALVKGHLAQPTQHAWVRAIAGMHHHLPGGVESLADKVAARDRKALSGGAVREALGVSPERFLARLVNRYQAARRG